MVWKAPGKVNNEIFYHILTVILFMRSSLKNMGLLGGAVIIVYLLVLFIPMHQDLSKMPICIRGISGAGIEFYTGDTGDGEHGGECEPLSNNRCNAATGEYGWKQFMVYLFFHRNYIKCGKKRRTDGR